MSEKSLPLPMILVNFIQTLSYASLVVLTIHLRGHAPQEPNDALHFDQPIAKELPIEFQIEEDLYPTCGEFKIVEFAFLSRESGDR